MIDSLRISITSRCNLKCPYCHNEGQLMTDKEISLEKIKSIINAAKLSGIKKIKITGGEPLLRKDIVKIVKIIKEHNFEDISLVTNGIYLEKYALLLKKAGLNRINIGCDSLDSGFLKNKDNMIRGLIEARKAGLNPIKINMVVLKDINHNKIDEMIEFAKKHSAILQLIELVKTNNNFYKKHYFDLKDIEIGFKEKAVTTIEKEMHNRKQYNLGDAIVEVVRPFHNKFCENCKRIRITADGKIKRCLMRNDNLIEYKDKKSLSNAIIGCD